MCDGERGTHLAWAKPPAGRRRAHRVSRRAERRTAGGEAAVRGATGGAGDTAAAAAAARERSDDGWLAATVPFAAPRVRACGRRSFRNVEDYLETAHACVIVCSAQSPLLFCRRRKHAADHACIGDGRACTMQRGDTTWPHNVARAGGTWRQGYPSGDARSPREASPCDARVGQSGACAAAPHPSRR